MGEFAVVLEIKMTVEETENKVGIWKGPHRKAGDRSPVPYFFVIYSFGNNRASDCMSEAIHEFMITSKLQVFTTGTPLGKRTISSRARATCPYKKLQVLLEPFHTYVHGALTMAWIGQSMVRSFDDMNLFGCSQAVKDLPCLVDRYEFILFSMNDQAVRHLR